MFSKGTKISASEQPRRSSPVSLVTSVGIVLFWLAMMALLVWHQRKPEELFSPDPLTGLASSINSAWQDSTEYAYIVAAGVPVGTIATTMTREMAPTPHYTLEAAVSLCRLGVFQTTPLELIFRSRLDERFALEEFCSQGTLPGGRFAIAGRVEGRELLLESHFASEVSRFRYRLSHSLTAAGLLRPSTLRTLEVKPGSRLRFWAVDPLWSMRLGAGEIEIGEQEEITVRNKRKKAYRVTTKFGDFRTTGWVDEAGKFVKQNLVGSVAIETASEEECRSLCQVSDRLSTCITLNKEDFVSIPATELQEKSFYGPATSLAPSKPLPVE